MSHVLKCQNLGANLVLCQLLSGDMLIFCMIRTVNTAIDAIIGQIERRKNDNAVAIKCQLDFLRDFVYFLNLIWIFTGEQYRGFPMGESCTVIAGFGFLGTGFVQNFINECVVVFVFFCIGQGCTDFLVADKLLCLERLGIISCHHIFTPSCLLSPRSTTIS